MPLTVFDIKGVPGNRHERIEAAVVAGARHASGLCDGVAFRNGCRHGVGSLPGDARKALDKRWAAHRKQHGLDLYGKPAAIAGGAADCGHL